MKAHEAARSPCMAIYKCIILINPTLDATGALNLHAAKTVISSRLWSRLFIVWMFFQNSREFWQTYGPKHTCINTKEAKRRGGKNPNMLHRRTDENKILQCGQRNVSFLCLHRGRVECWCWCWCWWGGGPVIEQQIENKMPNTTVCSLNAVLPQFHPQRDWGKPLVAKFELHIREPSVSRRPGSPCKQEGKQELVPIWLSGQTRKHNKTAQDRQHVMGNIVSLGEVNIGF